MRNAALSCHNFPMCGATDCREEVEEYFDAVAEEEWTLGSTKQQFQVGWSIVPYACWETSQAAFLILTTKSSNV